MIAKTKTLQIHDWMLRLGLTEKQERVYALIYGYSQDGMSRMRGTAAGIAEWLHCTLRNAQYILRQLEDKGLIAHEVVIVPKTKKHPGGVLTEFWAIDPDEATAPGKGTKGRIPWKGSRRGLRNEMDFVSAYETDFVTHHRDTTKNKHISGGGGKNKRASARKTTTTTGFLFENEFLNIPFAEDFFLDAWTDLLKQPKWAGKTPKALQIVLDRFALTNDPVLSAFCCIKAIERDWATIADPSKIGLEDQDQLLAYNDTIKARKEGAQL